MIPISQVLVCFSMPFQGPDPTAHDSATMSWMAGGVVAICMIALLGFQYLNHRRKLQEMKLKSLESLARQGKIGREDIDRVIGDQEGFPRFVLVLSWIGFLVGTFLVIISQIEYRWENVFLPAALIAIVSFGVLSAPFLLRELRRTQES